MQTYTQILLKLILSTDSDMVHATPKFVKDTSKFWYKPNITREDGKKTFS